ncbi:hypothetical protein RND81_08G070900 [Saponaria officinalis]|uniref:SWIM-type domain-containing protein n=1 Tax=Saponaria officinalis TaxID=3572 RepID=A0AAW1J4R5_SAPOF
MAAAGAGDVLKGVYEASISGSQTTVERRPYHKNCSCALHGSRDPKCSHHKITHISYPIRRSWSEGALALYAASSSSPDLSPSSSPTVHHSHHHHRNHSNVCDQHVFGDKLDLNVVANY